MLMRFEPYSELERITKEMLKERRVRPVAVDAYRRGNEFKVALDLPGASKPRKVEITRVGSVADAVEAAIVTT